LKDVLGYAPNPARCGRELDRLVAYLGGQGYAVRVADGVLDRAGHFAGGAKRRAAGVLDMFGDPEVSLVMPVNLNRSRPLMAGY
jgi:muramoyltetrapeptide carboxypeptidase LdcA involved in peptidoglycan recycling